MGLAFRIIPSDPNKPDKTFYARITNWDPIQLDWKSNDVLRSPYTIVIKDEPATVIKKYESKANYIPPCWELMLPKE